ncbi:unnamed protein product, partial [Mesorhabditis spiculigera]
MKAIFFVVLAVCAGSAQANWMKLPSLIIRETQHLMNFDKLPAPIIEDNEPERAIDEPVFRGDLEKVRVISSEDLRLSSSAEEGVMEEKVHLSPPKEFVPNKLPSPIDDMDHLNRDGIEADGKWEPSLDTEGQYETYSKDVFWGEDEAGKERPSYIGGLLKSEKAAVLKLSQMEWESPDYDFDALPEAFDWRNVNGTNYCSPNRNQHIPVYCGSCWVFGTTGMLNDRFNVAKKGRWPMTMVSPQEIIDCGGKGNCQGGTVGDVLEHAQKNGLVEEGSCWKR